MSEALRPYPHTTDSGLDWIGDIPAHWETRRLKHVLREVNQRSVYGGETHLSMSQKYGLIDTSKVEGWRIRSESYAGGKLCQKGDLVLNRLKAHLGVFAHAPQSGVVSPDYAVFRLIGDNSVQYFEALLKSPVFIAKLKSETKGIVEGFWRLYTEQLLDIRVLVPPPEEQRQIGSFIKILSQRVNRLIRAKQRLIALLNEQKQAIIQRAVTRGLDPDVPLKPSGVDWLGEMPAHWEVVPLKRIARLKSGDSITALQFKDSGTYPVYGGNGLRGYTEAYTHEGDYVLIGRQGALCGNVNYAHGKFWASEHAVVASLEKGYDLTWFGELVRTMDLNQYSQSAAQPGLSVKRIQNVRAPLPPASEQSSIAEHIGQETKGIDAAIEKARQEINLNREYRTRLIADVVTGKLDVRGVEVPEFEDSGPDDYVTEADDELVAAMEEVEV
jgi:type I restriction enzyme S subunit